MDKVEVFYKFFEVENREAFSPDASVSIESFLRLIGAYNFDEQVVCQVENGGVSVVTFIIEDGLG